MAYFFESEEKKQALYEELESWVGTPFRHMFGAKKLGCDCIHFVIRVLEAPSIGVLSPKYTRIPYYNRDWHLHNSEEILLNAIRNHVKTEEVGIENPQDGDILLYRFGRVMSHSAFFCRGLVYHSYTDIGVTKTRLENTLVDPKTKKQRLYYGFRVIS